MSKSFNNLETVKFQQKVRPAAFEIYKNIWKGCEIVDLRKKGKDSKLLDKKYGIDLEIITVTGQKFTIQEKYRKNQFLKKDYLQTAPPYPDFTQEFKNAAGTIYENKGEWFNLTSQLYFYGWTNVEETDFETWVILDVMKYKMVVEDYGGLDRIGQIHYNKKHGKASFYSIPIWNLKDAFFKVRGLRRKIAIDQ